VIEFFDKVYEGIIATSLWEWLAVLSSILYVFFAAKKNIVCWFFALIASFLYIYVCFISMLYVETILHLFYLVMAVVGWLMWHKSQGIQMDIKTWTRTQHAINIFCSLIMAALLGYIFDTYTGQQNPYIDAFTTCYSLAATYMVTKKVLENWLYWIIIDAVSIYLYATRGLELSALLFFVFTLLAVWGYFSWSKQFKNQLT
jgi:nicotinamide mononucleotide transporter